ncbi:hypothetical protein HPB47_003816 [Ixodes persulcatus]|uniref:Uncharacterized protein n=1 Tax=Ixodes persulcatus TaxID=34615 RepID=A0AC60PIQ9_IXOPE|nr:hypothetical protein HPB47_003816 [Ixodes persulcatus]
MKDEIAVRTPENPALVARASEMSPHRAIHKDEVNLSRGRRNGGTKANPGPRKEDSPLVLNQGIAQVEQEEVEERVQTGVLDMFRNTPCTSIASHSKMRSIPRSRWNTCP